MLRAVEIIACNRASDVRKMDADLMCASGFQPEANQGMVSACLDYAVVRHGMLPVFPHGAARAHTQTCNRRVNRSRFLLGDAVGDGKVFADEAAGMQLGGHQALRMRVARHAHQAAGALVQPV